MLTAIIVDDMPLHRENLFILLQKHHPEIKILAECSNADEGIDAVKEHHPEIVFLDVEMPGKTGFDLVGELHDIAFDLNIIFTTAHEHYALKAIKASALDFLLKPVNKEDLNEALQRLNRKRTKEQVAQQIDVLFQHYAKKNDLYNKIALPTLTGSVFVQINDIIRCESDDYYTKFFLTGDKQIMVSKTLKEAEELLTDYGFFRIHNRHLINMRHINEYVKGEGGMVKMNDGSEIAVSRRKKDEFLQELNRL